MNQSIHKPQAIDSRRDEPVDTALRVAAVIAQATEHLALLSKISSRNWLIAKNAPPRFVGAPLFADANRA